MSVDCENCAALREEVTRLSAPTHQCRNCGSLGPFTTVQCGSPLDGYDYDLECPECQSTEIAESPREAFQAVEARAEKAEELARITGDQLIACAELATSGADWDEPLDTPGHVRKLLEDRDRCRTYAENAARGVQLAGILREAKGSTDIHGLIRDVVDERRKWRERAEAAEWKVKEGWESLFDEMNLWFDAVIPHTAESDVHKFREEASEFVAEPSVEEASDVLNIVVHWCHLKGFDLKAAVRAKFEKNKARKWRQSADGSWKHVEESSELSK